MRAGHCRQMAKVSADIDEEHMVPRYPIGTEFSPEQRGEDHSEDRGAGRGLQQHGRAEV
ncbi:hypothetical protein ACTI_79540 [Actinoplanes sp. OR16]|nr:hypothetical protein ACTI_79540 [Actinoplanes sp. OR16]